MGSLKEIADLCEEHGINSPEVDEKIEELRSEGSDFPDVWDEMSDDEKESMVDAIYDHEDLENPDRWNTPNRD